MIGQQTNLGSGHLHVKVEVFHQSKVKFNGVELNIIKIQESLKKFSVMYRPYIFEMWCNRMSLDFVKKMHLSCSRVSDSIFHCFNLSLDTWTWFPPPLTRTISLENELWLFGAPLYDWFDCIEVTFTHPSVLSFLISAIDVCVFVKNGTGHEFYLENALVETAEDLTNRMLEYLTLPEMAKDIFFVWIMSPLLRKFSELP